MATVNDSQPPRLCRFSPAAGAMLAVAGLILVAGGPVHASDGFDLALDDERLVETPWSTGSASVDRMPGAELAGAPFALAVLKAAAGRLADAKAFQAQVSDPLERKIIDWMVVHSGAPGVGYDAIMRFLAENPDWPQAALLRKRAERALNRDKASAALVLAHFARQDPETGDGKLALARGHLERGDRAKAALWAARAWRDHDWNKAGEDALLQEFDGLLTAADHNWRLTRLILAQDTDNALRTARLLSADHVRLTEVAAALIKGGDDRKKGSASSKLLARIPAKLAKHPGIRYAVARHYRKGEQEEKARKLVLEVPTSPALSVDPFAWWVERRLLARGALDRAASHAWRDAYALAKSHGYKSGVHFEQGEFLAGFIALRFLKEPKLALGHFARLRKGTTSLGEVARAEYWLGRTFASLGDPASSRLHFELAATRRLYFYGQMALDELGRGGQPLTVAAAPLSADAKAAFDRHELVRAIRLLAPLERDQLLVPFFSALGARLATRGELAAAADMAHELGLPHVALRVAKQAGERGLDIIAHAFPTTALPQSVRASSPVEPALVFALTRQESEFNPRAMSGVGARGLMQLMPATAKLVAKSRSMRYDTDRLLSDPGYNLALGSHHLADLLKIYNGSYVMVLAAYNAGPARVNDWVERFGDPRTGAIDPLDWVEAIPFFETRNYVLKVLQNVQVYRVRLDPAHAVGMKQDLARGRGTAQPVAAKPADATQGCLASASASAVAMPARCN